MCIASFQTAPVFGRSATAVKPPTVRSARRTLQALDAPGGGEAVMLVHGSAQAELPVEMLDLLRTALNGFVAGERVTLVLGSVDADTEISSQEAADLLNVSRPHIVKLAREGRLAHRRVGNRHRFALSDVLTFRQIAAGRRDEALAALSPTEGYTADDDF